MIQYGILIPESLHMVLRRLQVNYMLPIGPARNPEKDDKDVAGIPWGLARVDNINAGGATREGSVSVIDPATRKNHQGDCCWPSPKRYYFR